MNECLIECLFCLLTPIMLAFNAFLCVYFALQRGCRMCWALTNIQHGGGEKASIQTFQHQFCVTTRLNVEFFSHCTVIM
jgi:hypothetical protein